VDAGIAPSEAAHLVGVGVGIDDAPGGNLRDLGQLAPSAPKSRS